MTDVFSLCDCGQPVNGGPFCADCSGRLTKTLRAKLKKAVRRGDIEAFREALSAIERDFPPDLIIISAGFDSRRGDPLGGLMLEDSDFAEMTKEVLDLAYPVVARNHLLLKGRCGTAFIRERRT